MKYQFVAPWRFERGSPNELLARLYLERIAQFQSADLTAPKSQPQNSATAAQYLAREVQKADTSGLVLFCLDERGKSLDSEAFAAKLQMLLSQGARSILFVVGGAYGIPADIVKDKRVELISLSKMTLPHELAMVVLLEQVYRAHCILAKHPYHHGDASELARRLGAKKTD